jgi:O-acetyl-ADP-ribose deacetylase (regulator of RNase III)
MITYTQGNLLEADVDAVVNTVNTVGIMGKGIALMFKEQFPRNFEAYSRACDAGEVHIGRMFVTENKELFGPRWIINFPTKTHWRVKTKIDWVADGLKDLVRVIRDKRIRSIAIPPLGCGNGGLDWHDVRPLIETALAELDGVDALVYEPTSKYQNVAKHTGVEKLTPARALVAEMVRRYSLLGIECSILEVQKLGWFLERGVARLGGSDALKFNFQANKYGPYSHNLTKLMDSLDGSYLRCDKRLADADPLDLIWFNDAKYDRVQAYLNSGEGKQFSRVLEWASATIDGFESPLGMELLATVDWMMQHDLIEPTVEGVMEGLKCWAGGEAAGQRKLKIFDRRLVAIALEQLQAMNTLPAQ